jgi:hypothetical protein
MKIILEHTPRELTADQVAQQQRLQEKQARKEARRQLVAKK